MKPKFVKYSDIYRKIPKRKLIHCFAGIIGADWDRKSVMRELKRAKRIAIIKDIFNHNLAIEPSDESNWNCILRFDIQLD